MLVAYITVVAAAVLVLLLAGFLIAIAWQLTSARRKVARLAESLERTADETATLQDRIERADYGVAELAEEMRQATSALERALEVFDRKIPT